MRFYFLENVFNLFRFCMKLEDINTTMPDQVINHYMKKAGFIVNDPKLVKIISIASQKFISEIVNDVMQHHKYNDEFKRKTNLNLFFLNVLSVSLVYLVSSHYHLIEL